MWESGRHLRARRAARGIEHFLACGRHRRHIGLAEVVADEASRIVAKQKLKRIRSRTLSHHPRALTSLAPRDHVFARCLVRGRYRRN